MNYKAFMAMLARDARVARRNIVALLFQTFLQPLMFVFIFGRVMVGSGYMPPSYKSLLLPGIMALSMVGTGIWAVAMPLIANFNSRAKSKTVCSRRWTFPGSRSKKLSPEHCRRWPPDSWSFRRHGCCSGPAWI